MMTDYGYIIAPIIREFFSTHAKEIFESALRRDLYYYNDSVGTIQLNHPEYFMPNPNKYEYPNYLPKPEMCREIYNEYKITHSDQPTDPEETPW